jgi:hypothetical protein
MNTTFALVTMAVCFGGLAWGIGQIQRKAKTCAAHDHKAGRFAVILGYFCGIVAVGLFIAAFLMPPE